MKLPPKLLPVLRDPADSAPLELDGDHLVNRAQNRRYRIDDGVPVLLDESELGPQNVKMRDMYRWMAPGFDVADKIGNFFLGGKINRMRHQVAQRLGLKPGDRCLYTSIGTGLDLPFIAACVPLAAIELVGLDLSREMLRQCEKKFGACVDASMLVQANAERLPFAAGVFDVVLHLGGINLFDRPALAVEEMARVAKPGALVLIGDETPRVVKTQYQKYNPFTRCATKGMRSDFDPKSWVPKAAENVSYEEERFLGSQTFYVLTFRSGRAGST
jgi:ubiquinone/menaquinone biosynthesis C-methylase UbiE